MKKAAQYIRISDEDQSNFSLDGQIRYNKRWAEKNNVDIVATFVDDGKSAKNFDRPDWKKLDRFLKENQKDIDYLICIKYDRFSRNLLEALVEIQKIETKYKIMLETSIESIGIPRNDPDFFKRRTQYLLDAEAEWHRIRDRTKFGIHEANMQGRYVNMAPFGYKNKRDANDNTYLEIDQVKANIIIDIFEDFIIGHEFKTILKKANSSGLKRHGHSAIKRILTTHTYAGLIKTNSYRDEEQQIIEGTHQAIISPEKFWKVQNMLAPKGRFKSILNDDFPLRGKILCKCGKLLTGAKSKGKNNYVPYYKCNYHSGSNHNANKAHGQMEEIMKYFSLEPHKVDYIRKLIMEGMKETSDTWIAESKELNTSVQDLTEKIDHAESEYLNQNIDKQTFDKWIVRYRGELASANERLLKLRTGNQPIEMLVNQEMGKLTNLGYVYTSADTVSKQEIIATVFDRGLSYFDGSYRTPFLHHIFASKTLILKEKKLLHVEQLSGNLPKVPSMGAQSNTKIVVLLNLIKKISA